MPDRIEFRLTLPTAISTPTQPDPEAPFRILIMADFSGRAAGETPASGLDRAGRPPLPVDMDRFAAVMSRLAPRLSLPLHGETSTEAITLRFSELDDFHPDALCRQLESLQSLCRSRANPPNLADLAQVTQPHPSLTVESPNPSQPPTEDHNALLERLLGKTPSHAQTGTGSGVGAIDGLVKAIVQPHIVQPDHQQAAWLAATDALLGERLRAILHHPDFQALEATWRSTYDLVAHVDSDAVQIELFDMTRNELLADLRAAGDDPRATRLYSILIDQGVRAADGHPWSLWVGDYHFGATTEDIALLASLGILAAEAGGPFLAAAAPSLLGCPATASLTDPALWTPPLAEHQRDWQALRTSSIAPWLGLATPRILLRLPYGQKTDPIEQFPFEEMPSGRDADAYLWGNPAFSCARLIADGFMENGFENGLNAPLALDDLPAHSYQQAGERALQPAVEALLGERAALSILAHGVMPILGSRQHNSARLAGFRSLANPATGLAGRWQT
ncbi:MAG: type VI secretion system contractile sheath large subunit [Candidatus Competibacter denitrificans]